MLMRTKICFFFQTIVKYFIFIVKVPIWVSRTGKSLEQTNRTVSKLAMLLADSHDAAKNSDENRKSTAIMTVFILKENILFLEEWLVHHVGLGVDHFVLYDNSRSKVPDELPMPKLESKFDGGRVNRHNIDYGSIVSERLSDNEIADMYEAIRTKYSNVLTVLNWEPTNESGEICHFQDEAIKDFVCRYRSRFSYGIHIDIDEFLYSENDKQIGDLIDYMEGREISSGYISQRRFVNRFTSLDTQVRQIPYCLKADFAQSDSNAPKTIFRMSLLQSLEEDFSIHFIPTILRGQHIDPAVMRFNHYQWPTLPGRTSLVNLTEAEEEFLEREFVADMSMLKYIL